MVNVQPYTVQCVLPINLYNEFIYVFLWYWMLLVSATSVFRSVRPLYESLSLHIRISESIIMTMRNIHFVLNAKNSLLFSVVTAPSVSSC